MREAALFLLSHGERKGPDPQGWEGEGLGRRRLTPSSSRAFGAGPSFSRREKQPGELAA